MLFQVLNYGVLNDRTVGGRKSLTPPRILAPAALLWLLALALHLV